MKLARYGILAALLLCSCQKSEPPADKKNEPQQKPQTKKSQQKSPADKEKMKSTSPTKSAFSPGPKIGEKAPEFELKDQNGDTQTLAALTKDGKIALVFYRSADW